MFDLSCFGSLKCIFWVSFSFTLQKFLYMYIQCTVDVRKQNIRFINFEPNIRFGFFLALSQTVIYIYIYFFIKRSRLVKKSNRTAVRSTNRTSEIRTKAFGFQTLSENRTIYKSAKNRMFGFRTFTVCIIFTSSSFEKLKENRNFILLTL